MSNTLEYMEPAAPKDLTGPRFGRPDEHRKVRRMIRALKARGFKPHSLAIEGEGYVRTPTEREALCEVFEWDADVTLRFKKGRGALYGVLLVTGNGEDIVSDYTWDCAGPFTEAMRAFEKADDTREV